MFASPGSILFQLGPLTVRWYGVMIALGFLAAAYVAARLASRWQVNADQCINAALVSFIGGVIGARLYFVALSWSSYASHPADILATWKGGGSIHGGLIGGVLAAALYLAWNKMPVLTCLDIGGVVLPLGQAIGRWGNFFNSEAFGRPVASNFPFKLFIPVDNRPVVYRDCDFFHPTFLYESLWDLGLFAILYFVLSDKLRPYPGIAFLVYLAGYSLGRVFIEMLRVDSIMLFGYPAPILVSVTCLFIASSGIILLAAKYNAASAKE